MGGVRHVASELFVGCVRHVAGEHLVGSVHHFAAGENKIEVDRECLVGGLHHVAKGESSRWTEIARYPNRPWVLGSVHGSSLCGHSSDVQKQRLHKWL